MGRRASEIWDYWTLKSKGKGHDDDKMKCSFCEKELIRKAFRCEKHIVNCSGDVPAEVRLYFRQKRLEKVEKKKLQPEDEQPINGVDEEEASNSTIIDATGATATITTPELQNLVFVTSMENGMDTGELYLQPKKMTKEAMPSLACVAMKKKIEKLTLKLKERDLELNNLKRNSAGTVQRLNDKELELKARDVEFTNLRAENENLKVSHAKLEGQLIESEKWKAMVANVMNMAQSALAANLANNSGNNSSNCH